MPATGFRVMFRWQETLIASFIDTGNTIFSSLTLGSYKLTVRVSGDEAAVTRGYEVSQRVSPSSE